MGPDYIGPAVDHFQEISAQYPEVIADLLSDSHVCVADRCPGPLYPEHGSCSNSEGCHTFCVRTCDDSATEDVELAVAVVLSMLISISQI